MERLERYRKFIELKQKISELTAEVDKIKQDVLNDLFVEDRSECTIDGAKFTVGTRRRWDYSPAVVQMDNELKALKKLEEVNGSAMLLSEGNHVKVTLPKKAVAKEDKFVPSKAEVVNNATGEVTMVQDHVSPFDE